MVNDFHKQCDQWSSHCMCFVRITDSALNDCHKSHCHWASLIMHSTCVTDNMMGDNLSQKMLLVKFTNHMISKIHWSCDQWNSLITGLAKSHDQWVNQQKHCVAPQHLWSDATFVPSQCTLSSFFVSTFLRLCNSFIKWCISLGPCMLWWKIGNFLFWFPTLHKKFFLVQHYQDLLLVPNQHTQRFHFVVALLHTELFRNWSSFWQRHEVRQQIPNNSTNNRSTVIGVGLMTHVDVLCFKVGVDQTCFLKHAFDNSGPFDLMIARIAKAPINYLDLLFAWINTWHSMVIFCWNDGNQAVFPFQNWLCSCMRPPRWLPMNVDIAWIRVRAAPTNTHQHPLAPTSNHRHPTSATSTHQQLRTPIITHLHPPANTSTHWHPQAHSSPNLQLRSSTSPHQNSPATMSSHKHPPRFVITHQHPQSTHHYPLSPTNTHQHLPAPPVTHQHTVLLASLVLCHKELRFSPLGVVPQHE